MPYSTTITALDFSGGVPDVRVIAGYVWNEVGGPTNVERKQDEVTLDIPSNQFLSQANPATFSYAGNLAPQPRPDWFIAMWIREIPRIANNTGWLFRSGGFTTEPPAQAIEVILAPEQFIGNAELSAAVGPLPMTSGSTTITALNLSIAGAEVALTAVGTHTSLPPGDTFIYTALLVLIPNDAVLDPDEPFDIRLTNPSLSFTAGVGQGFVTTILNALAGIIYSNIAGQVKNTVKGTVNAGVLNQVATRVNRGVPSSMPAGVVLSIRNVRPATRTTGTTTEPVIGVLAALAAFGGVVAKFPALTTGGGGCFIATAALTADAPEVQSLKAWRDLWLRKCRGGACLVAAYERVSPPVARFIGRSASRRALVRVLVVGPSAKLARWLLKRIARSSSSCSLH